MTELRHNPVPLPAGSFDFQALDKATSEIAAAAAKDGANVDEITAEKLGKINERAEGEGDGALLPGHVRVEREQVIEEGTETEVPRPGGKTETVQVGRVVVNESVQVFDPKKADEEIAATSITTTGALDGGGEGKAGGDKATGGEGKASKADDAGKGS